MSAQETVNVPKKLSKQEKLILELLSLHDRQLRQRELTKLIAEKIGKIEHISKQDSIDHGIKVMREDIDIGQKRLLALLITDNIRRMPRQGYTFVSATCRASVSRSIKRLQARGLIKKDVLGDVALLDKEGREPGGWIATCGLCGHNEFDVLDWHYKGSEVMRLKCMKCGVEVAFDPKTLWSENGKWNVLILDKETVNVG